MAESTEQEQLKQTQILQQTEKGQAAVSGKLDKVIAVLKEEGTQEGRYVNQSHHSYHII